MNHADLFARISKVLEGKIPFLLIGGFAVNAYKFSRQTADIDFMIIDSDSDQAEKALQKMDYVIFDRKDSFARFRDQRSGNMGIDLIFVDQQTFDAVKKNAKKIKIAQTDFLIPSLDHLISLKLHALKSNFQHRVGKDLRDILELAEINNLDLKSDSFKNLCLRYGTPDLYKKILEYAS